MTAFSIVVGGRSYKLPPNARVLTVPRLGVALVRVGNQVRAVNALGTDLRYSADECMRLWQEWA